MSDEAIDGAPAEGEAAPAEAPPAPLPTYAATLTFDFQLTPPPAAPAAAPAASDAADVTDEAAAEGEEAAPPPSIDGTYFAFTLPASEFADLQTGETSASEEAAFELAHPLSGEGAPESSSAEVTVSDALIRWLVVDAQGVLPLTLRRRGVDGAEDEDICQIGVDVGPLLYGKPSARASFEIGGAGAVGAGAVGEGVGSVDGPTLALPSPFAALASSCVISLTASTPLLSAELLAGLNPMAVTLLRAEGMPAHYSGTPYKRPYAELAERCLPVYASWSLLGTRHTCASRPHGHTVTWNERRLLLAGDRVVEPAELKRTLREVGLRLELHDRDPQPPPPPPPPPPPAEGEGEEGAEGGEEGGVATKEEGEGAADEGAEEGAAAAPSAAEPESHQHPPFGVASKALSDLLPRRPTDAAHHYAASGIPVRAPRRLTVELEVYPCQRPRQRPEPEEAAAEYYAGAYVEAGTELTVNVELAAPLPPEPPPAPPAELQRLVALIRYADTPMLLSLLSVVKAANDAIGMNSASAWEQYKEEMREDLDLITGVQLVDEKVRLFIFEGPPARTAEGELNAMGRLSRMLERTQPNSATAFTLMNSRLTFTSRLYNTFEMPTKLIKLRQPLPKLLLRPEVYEYLRVAEGCRDALLCLGQLLRASTLLYAYKAKAFPQAAHLLQLEKKFGGVQLVVDREGVMADDDADDDEGAFDTTFAAGGGKHGQPHHGHGKAGHGKSHRSKHMPRKAATDAENEDWYKSLAARELEEPTDWLAKNIAELPVPPTPRPLPEWYLQSIPPPQGPVYMYSGQRLNQTEVQKERLRTTLAAMHKEGKHMSYARGFLWADSVGDRERHRNPGKHVDANPDADLVPWDKSEWRQGLTPHFAMLQPSDYRMEELKEPWDEEALFASRRPLARGGPPPDDGRRPRPRYDPNPKASGYLEEGFEKRPSIFQQTEEEQAAERRAGVEMAIQTWTDKLVVDDPVLRVDGRIRDRPLQTDKFHSTLKDRPMKTALKSLYRGTKPMTRRPEVSAFLHEATVDNSLQERGPGLRATWTTMKWPEPKSSR